jgi:probable phosphoglycerate mutase
VAESLPDIPVSATDLLEDRTPVPSSMHRNEYPQRYLPWLDQTPQAERDVDATALSRAVDELAREAVRRAQDGPLILVTHAFVIGWFVRAALDAPTWRWLGLQPTNTSLTVVRYGADGTSTLVAFNDDGHLRQQPVPA